MDVRRALERQLVARAQEIHETRAELARSEKILREQLTALRLGTPPLVVRARLRAEGVDLPTGQIAGVVPARRAEEGHRDCSLDYPRSHPESK